MRIVFMGTPDFAVPSLKMLIDEGYEVVAVVTQPDKPKGRGNKLTAPPVKECAVEKGIPVLQPGRIKTQEFTDTLKALKPDLIVTCAYGKILPDYLLQIPPMGCINVHGSLLPKYRGAAPIQWSIINGDKVTGITTMMMDVGMDTGDMLLKREMDIPENMTAGELFEELSRLGADTLRDTLKKLQEGVLTRTPQPHEEATYVTIIDKEVGKIDWSKPARDIHNLVRGTDPWPGAYTFYKEDRIRIWKTENVSGKGIDFKPGTICEVMKDGLVLATGEGLIKIVEIQLDSGKRMAAGNNIYIRGQRLGEGEILG